MHSGVAGGFVVPGCSVCCKEPKLVWLRGKGILSPRRRPRAGNWARAACHCHTESGTMQGRETGLPVPLRDGILGWRGSSAGKGDCYMGLMTPSSNSGTRVKANERRDATIAL